MPRWGAQHPRAPVCSHPVSAVQSPHLALPVQSRSPSPLTCQPHLFHLSCSPGYTNRPRPAERSDLIETTDRIPLPPLLVLPEAQDTQINSQDVTDTVLLCSLSCPARYEVSQGSGHKAWCPGPKAPPPPPPPSHKSPQLRRGV